MSFSDDLDEVTAQGYTDTFTEEHADQYVGCVKCKGHHHTSAFCRCGRCFFQYIGTRRFDHSDVCTLVRCECGEVSMWD